MRALRDWFRPRHRQEAPAELEHMIERQARLINNTEPDTDQQWRSLESVLRQRPVDAPVPRRSIQVHPLRIVLPMAAVALVVILAVIFRRPGRGEATYQTSNGEVTAITLPDSSDVTLNHLSTLSFDGRSFVNSREVRLTGEALFHVRSNGTPFVVVTDIARVRVVGTEFDVRVRNDRMEVGVLTGRVRVSAERAGRDSTVMLDGGERTSCANAGYPEQPTRLLLTGYPAWLSGKMVFSRAPVDSVCEAIASTFDVAIRLTNPSLRSQTITGAVDARNVETAVRTLARLTGMNYRHEDSTYILY